MSVVPNFDQMITVLFFVCLASRSNCQSKLIKTNQLLRRDTVHRGQEAFREVGEALPEFALYDQDGHLAL